jgi:hypothetical protein
MSICLLWPLLLWPVLSAFGEAALRRPAANLGSDEFADMSMTLEAEQEKDMTQQVRQTETSATTEATSVADYIVERLAGAGSRLRARPVEGHVWRDALAIGNDSCANS